MSESSSSTQEPNQLHHGDGEAADASSMTSLQVFRTFMFILRGDDDVDKHKDSETKQTTVQHRECLADMTRPRLAQVLSRPSSSPKNSEGCLDVSAVLSTECFALWISTRKSPPFHPERAFQRTLTDHITGRDGRKPFHQLEEEALLKLIREQKRWPCFEQTSIAFGSKGFRARGFHERGANRADSPETLPVTATTTTAIKRPLRGSLRERKRTYNLAALEDETNSESEGGEDIEFKPSRTPSQHRNTPLEQRKQLASPPLEPHFVDLDLHIRQALSGDLEQRKRLKASPIEPHVADLDLHIRQALSGDLDGGGDALLLGEDELYAEEASHAWLLSFS